MVIWLLDKISELKMIWWMLLSNDTLHIHLNIAFNVQTIHLLYYNVFMHMNVNGIYVGDTVKGQIYLR